MTKTLFELKPSTGELYPICKDGYLNDIVVEYNPSTGKFKIVEHRYFDHMIGMRFYTIADLINVNRSMRREHGI